MKFDTTNATVVSNSDTKITATVPAVTPGIRNITVVKGAQHSAMPFRYDVLSDDQVQVIFKVNASTVLGENACMSSATYPELGNWDPGRGARSDDESELSGVVLAGERAQEHHSAVQVHQRRTAAR